MEEKKNIARRLAGIPRRRSSQGTQEVGIGGHAPSWPMAEVSSGTSTTLVRVFHGHVIVRRKRTMANAILVCHSREAGIQSRSGHSHPTRLYVSQERAEGEALTVSPDSKSGIQESAGILPCEGLGVSPDSFSIPKSGGFRGLNSIHRDSITRQAFFHRHL